MWNPGSVSSGSWDSNPELPSRTASDLGDDQATHDLFVDGDALRAMFHPRTVAVVGETAAPDTLGHKALAALTVGGFEGTLVAVDSRSQRNPFGISVYRELDDVPDPVDLAVVATRCDETLEAIEQCAAAGVRGVVLLSTADRTAECRREFKRQIRERLRRTRMKLIGPGCCALMNPSLGLNVSPGLPMPVAGNVAVIAQSGSLASTIIDWSHKGIVGFSAFVSLGDMVDVGWGNLIDYFGADWSTRAILVHMESIVNMRSFLSAARAVALKKPIIVIKAGRTEAAAHAFAWHQNCRVSADEVFDAALRRVGVIRVDNIEDLFHVADALSKQPRPKGPRLTIVSNAGGPGVLAADHVVTGATFVPQADERPNNRWDGLSTASSAQPFDVMGDGSSQPFLQAVEKAASESANDGLLLLLVPQAMSDPVTAVEGLLTLKSRNKPTLLCLPGPPAIAAEQEALLHACLPVFSSARAAARTFNFMWRYGHDLDAIYETPELHADAADRALRLQAGELISQARQGRRDVLSDAESREVLALYGIPSADSARQRDVEAGDRYELQIGCRIDAEFGPVVWIGAGGRLADLLSDRVVDLAPLNATLAFRMLERSILFDGLHRLAVRGEVDLDAIDAALVRLSQLAVEQPAIREVCINPLLISADGTCAGAVHIALHGPDVHVRDIPQPVFRPFPVQYVSAWTTRRGQVVTIRPIRAEDEPLMVDFHRRLSQRAVHLRYFQVVPLGRRISHEALTRACFVDYDREMVLVAERRDAGYDERQILAVASLVKLSRKNQGEIAVLVRDDYQRHGIGTELVRKLIEVARDEHLDRVVASTMLDNHGMCAVFHRLGFDLAIADGEVRAELDLQQPPQ
jgi:acetyltransferase